MEINEEKIIKKCQIGDLEQFGRLYDKYIQKIYKFIYYKTHHKETAEDLTSRTFMKALEKIGSFDMDKGTLQAWLYQIARNTVIDHYRTKKNDSNIEDIWDLADKNDIRRDLDARMKLEKIEKYLSRLKPDQREIIIMRVWQGLSHSEIAAVLGKSEAGVKMKFSRAMGRLRSEMPFSVFISLLFIKDVI